MIRNRRARKFRTAMLVKKHWLAFLRRIGRTWLHFECTIPDDMISEFTSVKELIENSRVIRFTPRGADKHGYWDKIIKEVANVKPY